MGGDEGNTYEVENVEKVANAIVSEKILWSSSSPREDMTVHYRVQLSLTFLMNLLSQIPFEDKYLINSWALLGCVIFNR
ncbi:hypothetical protein Bca4012_009049 [Brassica carinata]